LARGVNVLDGKIVYPAVAAAFGLPFTPLAEILDAEPASLAG
jgi:alanine dehydrogenase